MRKNPFIAVAALAASISIIAPTVAKADNPDREEFSVSVSYADLNLATAEGQARLEARIASKVRQLCDSGTRDLHSLAMQAECIDQARQQVAGQVRLAVANFKGKARRA